MRHVIGGRVNYGVVNPTFNPIAKAGDGRVLPRQSEWPLAAQFLTEREPIRPEYRDRDERLRVMDEQGLEKIWLFPTLGMIYEQPLKHDPEGVGIMFSAFNRWLEDDWGYDYEGRIFASPYISLADPVVAITELEQVIGLGARTICMRPAAPTTVSGSRTPGDPVRPVLGPRQRGRDHGRRPRRRQWLLDEQVCPGGILHRFQWRRQSVDRDALDGAGDLRLPRVTRLRPAVHPLSRTCG